MISEPIAMRDVRILWKIQLLKIVYDYKGTLTEWAMDSTYQPLLDKDHSQ